MERIVERGLVVEIASAGNASGALGPRLGAGVFAPAADVEKHRLALAEEVQHLFLRRAELAPRPRRERRGWHPYLSRLQPAAGRSPGLDPSMKDRDIVVPVVAKRPPQPCGVMAALG